MKSANLGKPLLQENKFTNSNGRSDYRGRHSMIMMSSDNDIPDTNNNNKYQPNLNPDKEANKYNNLVP